MIENKPSLLVKKIPLNTSTVVRKKRRETFGSFSEAMAAIRPVVAVQQAIEIFEKTFHLT